MLLMPADPHVIRFVAKVERSPDGCWLWTAATASGYGKFKAPGGLVVAHRYAYELLVGPIPDGLQLDHLCRVRNCVNPEHLEPVTSRENLLRGETITARRAAQTHCKHGHALDAENTYIKPNGTRNCRTCKAAANARHDAKRGRR